MLLTVGLSRVLLARKAPGIRAIAELNKVARQMRRLLLGACCLGMYHVVGLAPRGWLRSRVEVVVAGIVSCGGGCLNRCRDQRVDK